MPTIKLSEKQIYKLQIIYSKINSQQQQSEQEKASTTFNQIFYMLEIDCT